MAKENKKKSGIPRLLELAGEKKTLMVWGAFSQPQMCSFS